jgi:hypothetical protein
MQISSICVSVVYVILVDGLLDLGHDADAVITALFVIHHLDELEDVCGHHADVDSLFYLY